MTEHSNDSFSDFSMETDFNSVEISEDGYENDEDFSMFYESNSRSNEPTDNNDESEEIPSV